MDVHAARRAIYLAPEILAIIASHLCFYPEDATYKSTAMEKLSDTQSARLTCKAFCAAASPYLFRSIWISTSARDCERLIAVATHRELRNNVTEIKYDCRVYDADEVDFERFIRGKAWLSLPRTKGSVPHIMDFSDDGLGRGREIYERDHFRAQAMLDVEQAYEQTGVDDSTYLDDVRGRLHAQGTAFSVPEDSIALCWALKIMPNVRKITLNDSRFDRAPTRSLQLISVPDSCQESEETSRDSYCVSIGMHQKNLSRPFSSADCTVLLHPRLLSRQDANSETDLALEWHGYWGRGGRRIAWRSAQEMLANTADCHRSLQIVLHAAFLARPSALEQLDADLPLVAFRVKDAALIRAKDVFSRLKRIHLVLIADFLLRANARTDGVFSDGHVRNLLSAAQCVEDLSLVFMPFRSEKRTHPVVDALRDLTFPRLHTLTLKNTIYRAVKTPEIEEFLLELLERHAMTLRSLTIYCFDKIVPPTTAAEGPFKCSGPIRRLGQIGLELDELNLAPLYNFDSGYRGRSKPAIERFLDAGGQSLSSPWKQLLGDEDF